MSLAGGTPFWSKIEAAKYAHMIINERCAVKPGEEVLILTDTKTELEMSLSLAEAAAAAGARWNLLVQDPWMDESSPRILTDIAKSALLATDLFIDVGYSLYPDVPPEYTQMLADKKTRRMTLECRTLRSMTGGGADCDPKVFHDIGERMRPFVEGGKGMSTAPATWAPISGAVSKAPGTSTTPAWLTNLAIPTAPPTGSSRSTPSWAPPTAS